MGGVEASREDIADAVDRMRDLRVVVIGEVILDEYVLCNAIGKSGKEPVLVSRFISSELQGGGTLAVANHIAEFTENVSLISALGETDTREDFVRSALDPRVAATFVYKSQSPTIVKRRYVDSYSLSKMMGIYHFNPEPLSGSAESTFCEALSKALRTADVVVVADYGHGLITEKTLGILCANAAFLCINTQMNAANQGYHTLSKYPRADYACTHEGELRLDARDVHGDLGAIMRATLDRLGCQLLTVTRGNLGTRLLHYQGGFYESPALAQTVVERVGAGDAVFALTSLAAALSIDPSVIGPLGNLAGAQAVAVLGNRRSVQRSDLLKRARSMCSSKRRQTQGVLSAHTD
ncbi:MAG: PfkB family carbohydrate kinase [Myxococcota bacterium]